VFSASAKADTAQGTWSLSSANGSLQLEMHWSDGKGSQTNDHSGFVDAAALGIASALASAGQHATFHLHRDAGDFTFDGWLGKGEGAGNYTFTSNEAFFNALRSRGYNIETLNYKMAFATLDITNAYIDQMERLGYKGDVNHLVAMKALGVTPEYVAQLQSTGVTELDASHVISLKALHVNPQFIKEIASAGFPRLSANEYVTLKAMHVDAAYIRYLRSHGFKDLTVNQVVSMKAEGI